MNQDDVKLLLEERIVELEKQKLKIGVTYSRSTEIALDWINGLINVNKRLLCRLS